MPSFSAVYHDTCCSTCMFYIPSSWLVMVSAVFVPVIRNTHSSELLYFHVVVVLCVQFKKCCTFMWWLCCVCSSRNAVRSCGGCVVCTVQETLYVHVVVVLCVQFKNCCTFMWWLCCVCSAVCSCGGCVVCAVHHGVRPGELHAPDLRQVRVPAWGQCHRLEHRSLLHPLYPGIRPLQHPHGQGLAVQGSSAFTAHFLISLAVTHTDTSPTLPLPLSDYSQLVITLSLLRDLLEEAL